MIVDRILSGRQQAPEVVTNELINSQKDAVVLDIGPGTGRLKTSMSNRPDLRFVGMEYDFGLCPELIKNGYSMVVNSDANCIPIRSGQIDTSVGINVFHEVCNWPRYSERVQAFKNVIDELSRITKPSGELIIFEGVSTCDNCLPVTLIPQSSEAEEKLQKFIATYEAKKIGLQPKDGGYEGEMVDAVLLQTKYGYLTSDEWEGERHQLYPFINESDMIRTIENAGFNIEKRGYLKGRVGVRNFLKDFNVVVNDGSNMQLIEDTFPQTQIFIKSRKETL